MHVASNPTLVSDYLSSVGAITINREYQRGGGIWPKRAKSALIETVILGFPMPAMYIHQRYNSETKKPFKELVDGQQRTEALREFYEGKLRLSGTDLGQRLRGRTLQTLDDEDYQRFMSYSLPIFVFTDSSVQEVREAFRRLNSFNAILTPEETRHSTYHGPFKWFVHSTAREVSELLLKWDTFTAAQVNRMKDTALIAEILYAFLNGIKTTKSQQLNAMYASFDKTDEFTAGEQIKPRVTRAFNTLASFDWFVSSPITKSYQLMCLALAIMHAQEAIEQLSALARGGTGLRDEDVIRTNLGDLIEALEAEDVVGDETEGENGNSGDEEPTPTQVAAVDGAIIESKLAPYQPFVQASREKTNTADTRAVRFLSFLQAVARE